MASTNDRTNVTDNGYTYNGQNFTNETRTDSQGNQYTVALQSAIPTSSLQGIAPIVPTAPQYTQANQNDNASATAYINAGQKSTQAQADQLQSSKDSASSAYMALAEAAGNKTNDLNAAYNQVDANGQSVNDKLTAVNKISAESNAIALQQQANIQRETGKVLGQNITQAGLEMNIGNVNRQSTVRQLELAAQHAIANADYLSAKGFQDKIIDAKYEALTAKKEAALINLNNIRENLTEAQKKVADETTRRIEKEKQELLDKKAEEKQVNDMLIQASPVAPPDVLARAKAIQAKGGTATEVAMALGQYGGDFYKTALLKQQIETEKAQRSNYLASADKTREETSQLTNQTGTGNYNKNQLASITKLNQDVSKNATYAKTTAMRGYADNVTASLSQGTGTGDLAAINQFQKVIDEGAVTRDQDVKLIQSSQSLSNSLKTKMAGLEKGEQLSPELRKQMRTSVEALYNAQIKALNKDPYIQAKTKEAELYKVKPEDTILGELGGFNVTTNPNDTPEAKAMKAKLEASNPALKKQQFEGTSIIKSINGTAIDFSLPTTKN